MALSLMTLGQIHYAVSLGARWAVPVLIAPGPILCQRPSRTLAVERLPHTKAVAPPAAGGKSPSIIAGDKAPYRINVNADEDTSSGVVAKVPVILHAVAQRLALSPGQYREVAGPNWQQTRINQWCI